MRTVLKVVYVVTFIYLLVLAAMGGIIADACGGGAGGGCAPIVRGR